jgi:hypothetical protein
MGAAAHLDAAAVGAALEASPVVALAAAAAFQGTVVGAGEAVDKIETAKPRRGSIDPLLFISSRLFFLIKNRCRHRDEQDASYHT